MRVGDKVRFLNDVGEGTIVKLIDKKTVSVLNEYGFEVPNLMKELVVIEAAKEEENKTLQLIEDQENNDELIKNSESQIISNFSFEEQALNEDINIYIALIPKGEDIYEFEVFIINDSNYELLYTLNLQNENKLFLIEANKLENNTKIHVSTVNAELFNEVKGFNIKAIVFNEGTYVTKPNIDVHVPINPVKLYKENLFTENDFFDDDAFIIKVVDESYFKAKVNEISKEEIEKIKKLKEKKENPLRKNIEVKKQKDFENEMMEVDLHINELIDKVEGLDNGEKLQIQLDHFQKKLEEALALRKKRVVFIHGVGNGVLKVRLRNLLDREYKHLKYQDASFQQYGYGATIVFLRK